MRKRRKKIVLVLAALLIAWCAMALYLRYSVEEDSVSTFTMNINDGKSRGGALNVNIIPTKHWYNNKNKFNQTIGAQYDGIITNRYAGEVVNWKLIVTLPEDVKLDSYWNGKYVMEDGKLTITPDHNINNIVSGESRSFGFVMIAKDLLEFTEFQVEFSKEAAYEDHPLYWFLVFSIICWVIFAISYIISELRTKQYEVRRQKDEEIILQTMRTFSGMIDAKDFYTSGHSLRVASYSQELGRRMHLSEEQIRDLGYIALMHDCGKIGISDSVLTKPGKLTSEEKDIIQEHTTKGGKVLENFTAIEGMKEGALYHHERYDGGGYPYGLKGEEIPLFARIICVADSYDAMNTKRCYRPRLPQEVILEELEINKGTQFDPVIAAHMIDMINEGYHSVKDFLAQEDE